MTTATGFAVIDNGLISVRSVSDTERAAKINFLVTDRSCVIPSWMSDDTIGVLWSEFHRGAEVVAVKIELRNPDA